jgi:diaminopimelate decarboxylase
LVILLISSSKISASPALSSQVWLQQAAQQYGTPLYAYNLNIIRQQYHQLMAHLPENFRVHYALKANSNLSLCRYLADLGAAAEVSSLGEFLVAVRAGFAPAAIVFTGPGKTAAELTTALAQGVGLVVVESATEGQRLNAIAQSQGIIQPVLLRINPQYRTASSCDLQGCDALQPIAMNGQGASKFGTDEAAADDAIAALGNLPHLAVQGIHVFTESNVLDPHHLLDAWRYTLALADKLRSQGHPIHTIDFGGGIGVPYNTTDHAFDMAEFDHQLQDLLGETPYRYLLEIGRYLVCEAGHYLTQVLDIKQSQGQTFVIANGGVHNLYRTPAMQAASRYLTVLGKAPAPSQSATLAGQLPTPIDVIAAGVQLPQTLAVGDIIAIHNCGAYGFNHSLTNFSLHPHPAEVAWSQGTLTLIRDRGRLEDFFAHQPVVTWPESALRP